MKREEEQLAVLNSIPNLDFLRVVLTLLTIGLPDPHPSAVSLFASTHFWTSSNAIP